MARIWTAGRPRLAVTLASANPGWRWQATAYSGSKAEYGADALEFAPLPPGAYVVTVPELNARLECELRAGAISEIVFEPAVSPPPATLMPSATPTAPPTATPTPLPSAPATPSPTPTPLPPPPPLPMATPTALPPPATATPTPTPLPPATATPTAPPTVTASPAPGSGWRGRVASNTIIPGNWFAVIRVRVAGKAGWPVRITIVTADPKPWTTVCRTGTKPEYGPDYCEFAPLIPASYTISLEGYTVATPLTVERGGVAEVVFEEY